MAQSAKKILIVDDTELDRKRLGDLFKSSFQVLLAGDGKQAVQLISAHMKDLSAVLMDLTLPQISGLQVLGLMQQKKITDRLPILIVTADQTAESERTCYQKGAADVIHKPFDTLVVEHRVKQAIELYERRMQLEKQFEEQTAVLQKQFEMLKTQESRLRENNKTIIDIICSMVEFRDLESGDHLRRIKGFTKILATAVMQKYPEYGLNPHRIDVITQASAMHDIGKITVPDAILLKPGRLNPDEFDIMKSHTTRGAELVRMLSDIQDKEYYEASYDICRHHHEKYDGKGYPDGLKGESISIAAQITSVADVYDALISDRVYKAAYTPAKAYEMIWNGEAGQFSPKMLSCLEAARGEMEAFHQATRPQVAVTPPKT